MIYDVFLPFIIIFSIFSIIIILARKIPDISLEPEVKKDWLVEEAKKQHRTTVLLCKVLSLLEKTLRHLRIHILKLDAKIFGLIQYLREKSTQKLEEINKLSYKSFVPTIEKKTIKTQPIVKPQTKPVTKLQVQSLIKSRMLHFAKPEEKPAKKTHSQPTKEFKIIEKNILPVMPAQAKPSSDTSSSSKIESTADRALGYANKIATKFNYKIEERKLLVTISRNPKVAENYKKLGMLYYNNENYPDTEAAFIEYLKLNPSDNEIKEIMKKVAPKNRGKN